MTGIAPVVTAGACVLTNSNNWGDQNRALPVKGKCESYFPVIHVLGDIHITGTQGQGILLVDGDLYVSGGFTFTGAVIVRGSLKTTGTGAHISGAVMAANVDLEDDIVTGNTSIRYSSCALAAVMNGSAYLKPVKQRAWVDLY
jgi:hypothetical protein